MFPTRRLLALAAFCLAAVPTHADNILACPGFETTADSGWWYHASIADSVGVISIQDSSAAHTGTYGAKAVIKQTSANYYSVQLGIPRNWTANLGSSYSLTFWAKADSARSLLVNTQKKHGYGELNRLTADLDTMWQQFTVPSFVIADTSDTGNGTNGVQVSINFGDVVGTFYFDDFDLEETPDSSSGDAIKSISLASPMQATLRGRELSLSSVEGPYIRLLDLDGHTAATAPVAGRSASLTVPAHGVWIVDAGISGRKTIAIP
ncbi:MAG TPA: hypothetical protein VN931_11415 [Fibrobacteria bacterium]|nr:hypothetical protein [Fibrobacteria bacterium]